MADTRSVRFTDDQLSRARELQRTARDSLIALGQLVAETLSPGESVDTQFTTVTVNLAARATSEESDFDTSGCWEWKNMQGGCVAYCDPPGLCAPCTPGSSSS
jgi:hypothetical protein